MTAKPWVPCTPWRVWCILWRALNQSFSSKNWIWHPIGNLRRSLCIQSVSAASQAKVNRWWDLSSYLNLF